MHKQKETNQIMLKQLKENEGISTSLLWIITLTTGLSVANLYYCQPLLSMIQKELEISEVLTNTIAIVSQIGYALGLFFIVPLGDMLKRRTIILTNFTIISLSLLAIGLAPNIYTIWIASFITGLCSVTPQLFLPLVSQFSTPKTKGKNVGIVVSGLLTGILSSRVFSGFIGEYLGWRSMYYIAASIMALCFVILYQAFPIVLPNFKGKYKDLMKSVVTIAKEEPKLRFAAIKSGLAFGSFLSLWAMLAFKMAQAPFYAGGTVVGLLGLCGIAGALAASFLGRYVQCIGIYRINWIGAICMITAWVILFLLQNYYIGIILGIIILDIGMQCIQLGNQTSMLTLRPSAANRVNTIFMTTYFIGGATGTTLTGFAWGLMQWNGVVLTGLSLIIISLIINTYQYRYKF